MTDNFVQNNKALVITVNFSLKHSPIVPNYNETVQVIDDVRIFQLRFQLKLVIRRSTSLT